MVSIVGFLLGGVGAVGGEVWKGGGKGGFSPWWRRGCFVLAKMDGEKFSFHFGVD